jgi:hypothetical protein
MYIESSTKDAGLVEIPADEPELVHEYAQAVEDENGTLYRASVWGRQEPSGQWIGWIEFHALGLNSPVLSTDRETTQSTRAALEYWASGLGAVYLDGALSRASTPVTERRSVL